MVVTFYNIFNLIYPIKKEKTKIHAIAKHLGIDELLFTKTANLSGGQQQRVAIARALYRDCEIVLADEPVSSVDSVISKTILETLTSKNNTIIAALHNVDLAIEYFDRFIGLHNKKIVFDLTKKEVTKTDFERLYRK